MSRVADSPAASPAATRAATRAGPAPALLAAMCPALLAVLLLGACASAPAPPPGTQVTLEKASAIEPGRSTRASLLATLGPTHKVVFDSGREAWLYQLPVAGGFDELVVLLDADGVVRKLRRRAHAPAPAAAR